jgi:hypothetical protein
MVLLGHAVPPCYSFKEICRTHSAVAQTSQPLVHTAQQHIALFRCFLAGSLGRPVRSIGSRSIAVCYDGLAEGQSPKSKVQSLAEGRGVAGECLWSLRDALPRSTYPPARLASFSRQCMPDTNTQSYSRNSFLFFGP